MFKKISFVVLFLVAMLAFDASLFAQGCSVSTTTTTAGTSSTACFTKQGNQVNFALTGTWVGEMALMRSDDAAATYRTISTYTANVASITEPANQDTRFKWYVNSYTSGTISYSLLDSTKTLGRSKYSNTPIGSVAYGSLGTAITTASTSSVVVDLFVEDTFTATGVGLLSGASVTTTKYAVGLYDSTCRSMNLSTAVAGTTMSGTNAFTEIAFTQPVVLSRGRYHLFIQGDSSGPATIRAVAASTFITPLVATVASTTFGTFPTTCTTPTTFTADKAPFIYLY